MEEIQFLENWNSDIITNIEVGKSTSRFISRKPAHFYSLKHITHYHS